jgi:putative oxygen-independent coproporphyrinogen III oxidase
LPVPADGALPGEALAGLADTPLGIYAHVPYCTTRCGYCDFNTYTALELGGPDAPPGADRATWADAALAELTLAARVLGPTAPAVSTVFLGGGTPTLLPPADLGRFVAGVRDRFGLLPGAEITTEGNPETLEPASLAGLLEAGFTRLSVGMQAVAPHVLATLDRRHTPGRAALVVEQAHAAGFASVSVDLIYGTPGETAADLDAALAAAVDCGADHVSAYSLIVENGTRLAARVRRGELPMPDDDVLADRYEQVDAALAAAGFSWYEVSNWALTPADRCRHNLTYWRGANWWGVGPGAHSHVGGVRWWNRRHPAAWARALAEGVSPGHARELLDPAARHAERVLLELRLADGLDLTVLDDAETRVARRAVADGLLESPPFAVGRAVPTRRGRLLVDGLVADLLTAGR